jgi:hypothetical protein
MSVYFHGNFGLHRARMAGVLKRALENPSLKDEELAAPFDYGAPFAAKYRSWLHKTGIVEQGLPVHLTPAGQVVYEEDPNLASHVTQWLMHWELSQDPSRAEAWYFFANEFLPQHGTFEHEELLDAVTQKLRIHSEAHFGPGSKLNPIIVRKLLECYTAEHALGELGIIKKEGTHFVRGNKFVRFGPWQSLDELSATYH